MSSTSTSSGSLFASALYRLPLSLRLTSLVFLVALVLSAGFWGDKHFPHTAAPTGSEAEREIAAVFSLPPNSDDKAVGDFVIERFYTLDPASGKEVVFDLCKGRIRSIGAASRDDGRGVYHLLLDRRGLKQQVQQIATATQSATATDSDPSFTYGGLQLQDGDLETFNLNYDGTLPRKLWPFRGPAGQDIDGYLHTQSFDAVSDGARLVPSRGTNYLLSNTQLFPYFRTRFQVQPLLLLSTMFLLDNSVGTPTGATNNR